MHSDEPNSLRKKGAVRRREAGSFEGISLGAYRRLLGTAIRAAHDAGAGEQSDTRILSEHGVPPHLAKVYGVWHAQQKQALSELSRMMDAGKTKVARIHSTFSNLRGRVGEEVLEAMMRVYPNGEIGFSGGASGIFSEEEEEACRSIYTLYTLAITAPPEARKMIAVILSGGRCAGLSTQRKKGARESGGAGRKRAVGRGRKAVHA